MKYNNVEIDRLSTYGFKISFDYRGARKFIYINPNMVKDDEDADLILITIPKHPFFSINDINKIKYKDTFIFAPAEAAVKFKESAEADPGKEYDMPYAGIKVIPAFNMHKFDEGNNPFHSQHQKYCGYLITVQNTVIFYTGKTDILPEMKKIKCDILIPTMNNRDSLNTEETLDLVNMIRPQLVIPITDDDSDSVSDFIDLTSAEVRILDFNRKK